MDAAQRAALLSEARAWLADDPDPDARAQLVRTIDAGDIETLRDGFGEPLAFGTAGIRGVLGIGPARMNLRTVARTTAGLCRNLLDSVDDAAQRGLCIGFDGRHRSREFAMEAARVALGAGLRVSLFEDTVPTPLLAFATVELGAAGGIMITASHNPREYNGYKVYGPEGSQIVAPRDAHITAGIEACGAARALPRVALDDARDEGRLSMLSGELEARYLQALPEPQGDAESLRIAYTALHGVGDALCRRALAQAGFAHVASVPSQATPDPQFPTVVFPNPEEPGAMDAVLELAERDQAGLVLANDPDADRLAVAARDGNGVMRAFTGDQLGALLADHVLRCTAQARQRVVLRSIVSSRMLDAIAAHHGARAYATLTGFKWIYARARELEAQGATMVFGYEEALGYSFGQPARDKDGIHAAVIIAQLAQRCASGGATLWDRLRELGDQHGHHVTAQHSARYAPQDGRARIDAVMAELRAHPPEALGARAVLECRDMLESTDLPAADLVILGLEGGHRVCIRPSGTEPKIKLYFECVSHLGDDRDETRATEALAEIRSALLERIGLS